MLLVIWSPHGARLLESEDKLEETSVIHICFNVTKSKLKANKVKQVCVSCTFPDCKHWHDQT